MRMELPGSASAAAVPPPPRPQNQSSSAVAKPTTPAPDTSPAKAWVDAVAQATANSPQQHVAVEPGDTLTGIADHNNATLPGVERANPQITNPNLIYPRQTVYLPKTAPAEVVTGVDNKQIKPIITAMANANLADQGLLSPVLAHDPGALSGAQAQSAQSWDAVKQTTLKMLTENNHSPYPDEAASAEVQQLNALEPGNAKFAAANNAALAQATQQWKQMGVTKSQLSPIINAYDNSKQTTNSANQYLQNPHMPHNRAIIDDLMAGEQQANNQLNTAIEKSLADAANGAAKDPKARSAAMTDRAANIQLVGPQDPAFQTAVDNANYDLQVNKPAQGVADAYAKGGVQAAAAALKTATQDTSCPYYAGQIIQQSQGTIESIARDLGSIARNEPMPIGGRAAVLDPTPDTGDPKFNQIYADLSQSVAAANTITMNRHSGGHDSVLLSQGGKAAADIVGNAIAANAPKNLTPWQSAPYGSAATNAITSGDGAALTFATAAALKRQGNSDLASVVTEGAATGIQALQSKTSSDVTAFATTTTTLDQLRATWGPFMTENQLAKATNGYLADHPDVRQKADAQLATISQDGDTVTEAESAWNSYRGQLNGIGGQGDLSAAAKSLTGNDASTAFAVSQSPRMNSAIAAALGPSLPSQGSGGSIVQALISSPVWSFPRSARSALNNTLKWLESRNKATAEQAQSEASAGYGTGTYLALSGIGLGLTGLNAWSTWGSGSGASSPQQLASSAYTALGFFKYTGEVVSGFAKSDIVQKFLGNHPGFSLEPDKKILSLDLPNGSKVDLTNLTKAGWFKGLGSAYYGAGALANFLQAADDFKNGDYADGSFGVIGGVGNALNAAKPLIPGLMGEVNAEGVATTAGEAAADAVAALGSGLGLVAAGGTLIWLGIKSAINANHYQEDGSKFLQRGLGLNSNLADWLALPGQSASASASLNAYAHAYGLSPREQPGLLLSKLNKEPLDKAIEFINEAAGMPTQPGGGYAASMPGDGPNKVGTHSVTMLGDKGHNWTENVANQADSLRQLKYWADYLFGKNQLG
jgi:LysM repeat protein